MRKINKSGTWSITLSFNCEGVITFIGDVSVSGEPVCVPPTPQT